MKEFIRSRYVPVWIEDKKDDPMAKKLGISQEGYPNVAVYDAGGEFVGRVVGFGGKDSWFGQVKDSWAVGEKLATAKAKAEKDPAAWSEVALILAEIDGRMGDGLAALEKVPEGKRGSKEYKSAKALLSAKEAWSQLEQEMNELFQAEMKKAGDPSKGAEVLKTIVGPKGLERVDAWLKAHERADPALDAVVWAKKGFFLVRMERRAEAADVVRKILKDWPDSPQAHTILGGLR